MKEEKLILLLKINEILENIKDFKEKMRKIGEELDEIEINDKELEKYLNILKENIKSHFTFLYLFCRDIDNFLNILLEKNKGGDKEWKN